MMKRKWICIFLAAMLLSLTACDQAGTKVVLTTGFAKNEVFRIEDMSCRLPEAMVYLVTMQNQYEEVYGEEIWQVKRDGVTLAENVKETVLAKIAQVKTLNLLAESKQVSLDASEKEQAGKAAAEYYESLSEEEIVYLGISEKLLVTMYEEYALAEKVYEDIIKDINPEISDDEARIITVQHILIKTYIMDGTGAWLDYTEIAKSNAYKTAEKVYELAQSGEQDFESLIAQYSEDAVGTYSFGKGEMTESFEEAAFNLSMNEISGIVEDKYGYHIIKCISTFNREETDRNKLTIVEQRKKEVFGMEYDAFVETLTRMLNEELWKEVKLADEPIGTLDFFDIFDKYFP